MQKLKKVLLWLFYFITIIMGFILIGVLSKPYLQIDLNYLEEIYLIVTTIISIFIATVFNVNEKDNVVKIEEDKNLHEKVDIDSSVNLCEKCNVENSIQSNYCSNCGERLIVSGSSHQKSNVRFIRTETSGKAIASLILSIIFPGLGSIIAIILGHMARSDINKSQGKLTGSGIALAGLIIGYVILLISVIYIIGSVMIPRLIM